MDLIEYKKLKGFTLIEVMLMLGLLFGFTLVFLQMDINLENTQNTKKVGLQLNQIITAYDKRITIDGKEYSKWQTKSWLTPEDFKKFLKLELIGKDNKTCGSSNGWNPTLNLNGLDPTSKEGNEIVYFQKKASKSKLVPCTLWNIYPSEIIPSAVLSEDSNNNVKDILFKFKFSDNVKWKQGFHNFNAAFTYAEKQKSITLLTSKVFYYTDGSNEIKYSQCVKIKNACVFNIRVSTGSESNDDKKFKIDSSNNFETNLGFAKSIKNNDQLNCNIWTYNELTSEWNKEETACGITGGKDGYREVALLGENLDAEKVILKGLCKDYGINFVSNDTECGMMNIGSVVQLNNEELNTTKLVVDKLNADEVYTENLNVKKDSIVNNNLKVLGKKVDNEIPAALIYSPTTPYDIQGFESTYRDSKAGTSFKTNELETVDLKVSNEMHLNNLNTEDYSVSDRATTNETQANLLISLYETKTSNIDNKNGQALVNEQLKVNNYSSINKVVSDRTVIAGDIKASNIKASGIFQTEQLNFRKNFNGEDSILNLSKSANFDGLKDAYIYPKGYISGWGAEGYRANSGIQAKTLNIKGDMIVDSQSDALAFGTTSTADYITNHSSFRNGLTLYHQFPDTRSMFTMNEYGRVKLSPYYDPGTKNGLKIGGKNGKGFYWGMTLKNLSDYNDKPMLTNLSSSIYGYEPGDDITIKNGGYKMIVNDLTIKTLYAMNLYSGAYFHKSLPKLFNGSLAPINYITLPVGHFWETADNIALRHLNSNVSYYLNRILSINSLYLNLNDKGSVSGTRGDRGDRGETGVEGKRGPNGKNGIAGAVGNRGGL